jgi:hypothetical protein
MIIFSYEPRDAVVPLMDVSPTAALTLYALGATSLLVVVIMPDPAAMSAVTSPVERCRSRRDQISLL